MVKYMYSGARLYGFESPGRLISSMKSNGVIGRMNCSVLGIVRGLQSAYNKY